MRPLPRNRPDQTGSPDRAGLEPPYTIRPACPADLPYLPALEQNAAQAFCAIPGLEWLATGGTLPLVAHQASLASRTCWVAVDATGRLLGFLSACFYPDALHIQEMSVMLAAQGHGLGRRLLGAACAAARAQGVRRVTLTTFLAVPWNAPFYARAGFCIIPPKALNTRLASLLEQEAHAGFAPGTRSAMRLDLTNAVQSVSE